MGRESRLGGLGGFENGSVLLGAIFAIALGKQGRKGFRILPNV
jgi:hypothetical protein